MKYNKKKLAFVDLTNFKDWPLGGMLEYELCLLDELVKYYDVDIWGVSVDGEKNSSIEINGKKYPIHTWGNVRTSKKIIPNYWRGLGIINKKKEFSNKDYDIVYAHTGSCIVGLNYMINRDKTKLVYHQHGLNHKKDFSLMSLIQRPLLNRAQKISDLVFVVSDENSVSNLEKEMKNKSKAKYISIGSPVNLSKFNISAIKDKIQVGENKDTINFLYTGRLSAFKNCKTLLEAFYMYLKNVNENAILKIAGTGEEFDILQNLIKKYKIDENVHLLGAVPHEDIYILLQEADVFLTASGGEGVSVSVVEAYASGLPVVCFNVPGLEAQVIDNLTGVIAKERSIEGFFEAMKSIDSNKRTQLALNCLKEAKKYDSSLITKKIVNEIELQFKS